MSPALFVREDKSRDIFQPTNITDLAACLSMSSEITNKGSPFTNFSLPLPSDSNRSSPMRETPALVVEELALEAVYCLTKGISWKSDQDCEDATKTVTKSFLEVDDYRIVSSIKKYSEKSEDRVFETVITTNNSCVRLYLSDVHRSSWLLQKQYLILSTKLTSIDEINLVCGFGHTLSHLRRRLECLQVSVDLGAEHETE